MPSTIVLGGLGSRSLIMSGLGGPFVSTTTLLTIGLTTLTASDRATGHFFDLSLKISVDEDWELEWSIAGCGPNPPFIAGEPVSLSVDQGSGPVVVFQGNISDTPISDEATGWTYSYHAEDLKVRANWVSVQDGFGGAACQFNLQTDDLDYDPTRAGQTVGQIVAAVLQVYPTALNLFGLGVGGYTFVGTTATLAAQTLIDLAFMTFVPNFPVRIEGDSVMAAVEQFVKSCLPQYCCWVDATGVIRFVSPFGGAFTTVSLTIPGSGVTSPDPVEWPLYTPSVRDCFTQYQIIGQDYDGAILSTLEGSLTPVNSSGDRSSWTLNDHLFPSGAAVYGNASITSSTSATVTCDDPTASWVLGYWVANGGAIYLIDISGTDVSATTRRAVTISAAMSAGGSADIEWDSSQPLDFSSYTRFMLVGGANPLSYVDRLYWITNPWSGDIGLNTAIGSGLVNRDPNGIPWANESQDGVVFYAAAKVLWGINADNANPLLRWPISEIPVGVRVIKQTGQILLDDPAVLVAALAAGTADALYNGYPSTALGGLWYDLRVAVPFTRGPLVAQFPSSGFAGSAFTDYGVSKVKQEFLDSYTSRSQNANMVLLATEKAACVKDAILEGTILHHGLPTAFDAFAPGQSLLMVMPATSPLDSRPMPIRTTVIRWPNDAADIYQVSFRWTNRKAQFAGDSRYLHPNFTNDASQTYFQATGGDNGFFSDDWKSGMAGRAARQAERRRDKGPLPNTAGGDHGAAKPPTLPNTAGGRFDPPTPSTLPNTAGGDRRDPAKPSTLPNTAGGRFDPAKGSTLPNTAGGRKDPAKFRTLPNTAGGGSATPEADKQAEVRPMNPFGFKVGTPEARESLEEHLRAQLPPAVDPLIDPLGGGFSP